MKVLGLSYGYHDSAATLLDSGRIVAAAQEERFNRIKHYAGLPRHAVNYCLQAGDLTINDVDAIGFYEKPYSKFHRVVVGHLAAFPFSFRHFLRSMPPWLAERLVTPLLLKNELGYEGSVHFVKHHMSHAASAFLVSPFDEAAIMVSDGVGEWSTMSWGVGSGADIRIKQELQFPDSLGLVYTAVTAFLGFEANGGEGKTMGLADWGEPAYLDRMREIVDARPDGSFRVDRRYFDFISGRGMTTRRFVRTFGKPRRPGEPIEDRHRDIAASLQRLTEDVLLAGARHVHAQTGMDNLCLAGGSFLNCPVNTRILEETPFRNIFIQPAAGDAGGSLGVAAFVHSSLYGHGRGETMAGAALGPAFSDADMRRHILAAGLSCEELDEAELVRFVAGEIAGGKILGWFQGRMEFGPRALGSRSILASPCIAGMKDRLNENVKHRESFRPYGISILYEDLAGYFELDPFESPFMLHVGRVREEKREAIPSAIHVNGSSRIQTVTEADGLYHELLQAFKRETGVSLIINTSFNDSSEPIVCTPDDAIRCFMNTHMDYLVMGRYIARKV